MYIQHVADSIKKFVLTNKVNTSFVNLAILTFKVREKKHTHLHKNWVALQRSIRGEIKKYTQKEQMIPLMNIRDQKKNHIHVTKIQIIIQENIRPGQRKNKHLHKIWIILLRNILHLVLNGRAHVAMQKVHIDNSF